MYRNKRIVAIIPARAGSKRLAGKNHMILCGKPMIDWTVSAAKQSQYIDDIIISSNDAEVKKLYDNDDRVIFLDRDEHLATDSASSEEVILDALSKYMGSVDLCLLLQPTSPTRTVTEIDAIIEQTIDAAKTCAASFVKLPKPGAYYYGHCVNDKTQSLRSYSEILMITGSLYLFSTERFIKTKVIVPDDALVYYSTYQNSVDVDTAADFSEAEAILKQRGYAN